MDQRKDDGASRLIRWNLMTPTADDFSFIGLEVFALSYSWDVFLSHVNRMSQFFKIAACGPSYTYTYTPTTFVNTVLNMVSWCPQDLQPTEK